MLYYIYFIHACAALVSLYYISLTFRFEFTYIHNMYIYYICISISSV